MTRLSERKAINDDQIGNTPPVGAIMAYAPGYYTAIDNGGFTVTGPSGNTINECNTFLPDNWRVCDGAAINDAESPIWNAAGRRLPELTDSRFIRGATAAGNAAGANTKVLNTPQLPSHGHSASSGTVNAPHGHAASPNGLVNAPANAPHSHATKVNLNAAEAPFRSARANNGTDNNFHAPTNTVNAPHNQPHNTPAGGVPANNAPHSHPVSVVANNAPHSHTGSIGTTGIGDNINFEPNYVTCVYMIRVR